MRKRSHGQRFVRRRLRALVDAYGGRSYQPLTDVAGELGASVAYVDRATIEAHLERPLSTAQWTPIASHLTPMALDEQVGEAGTFRTDWIDDVLSRAGVPGRRPAGIHTAHSLDRSTP